MRSIREIMEEALLEIHRTTGVSIESMDVTWQHTISGQSSYPIIIECRVGIAEMASSEEA